MNVYQRYIANGDSTYYGRFSAPDPDRHGSRKRFLRNLGTPNREEALKKLRGIAKAAEAGRWAALDDTKLRQELASIGDVIACLQSRWTGGPRSLSAYVTSLRCTMRWARPELHDATDDSLAQQSTRILTPDLMRDMQTEILKSAGDDCTRQDSARTTANTHRRNVRAMFGSRLRDIYLHLVLPRSLDAFLAVKPLREPTRQFRMPPADLLANIRIASAALRQADANGYRIFLLSLGAGLRRNEISHARWSWLRTVDTPQGPRHTMTIQTEPDFRPKGRRSRTIPIEPVTFAALQQLRIAPADGTAPVYILEGGLSERTQLAFARFGEWLTGLGWDRRKKAHELRKVFGSYVNEQCGLSAAQDLLGHSTPNLTKSYYVGQVNLPQVRVIGL